MKMNLKLLKRLKMGAVILAVTAAGICYSCGPLSGEKQEIILETPAESEEAEAGEKEMSSAENFSRETAPSTEASCFVHVCGQVNAPGVYELEAGSRIYQAVEMAAPMPPFGI